MKTAYVNSTTGERVEITERREVERHCPTHGPYVSVNYSQCPTCLEFYKQRDAHLGARGGE